MDRPPVLDAKITDITGFSKNIKNRLQNYNILNVEDLTRKTEQDLKEFCHFSPRTIRRIKKFLAGHSLALGMTNFQNPPIEPISAYENKCLRQIVRFLLGQKGEPLGHIFHELLFLLNKQVERVILTPHQDEKAAEELFHILTDLSKKTDNRETLFEIYLMIGKIIGVIRKK